MIRHSSPLRAQEGVYLHLHLNYLQDKKHVKNATRHERLTVKAGGQDFLFSIACMFVCVHPVDENKTVTILNLKINFDYKNK